MYGKLFTAILDSSIMEESVETRLLWHYLITLADEDGNVDMTPEALARRVNMPSTSVNSALQVLSAPDPSSRSPAEEGRRIVPLRDDGYGWHLVNHGHYRTMATKQDRREYMRVYQQERRAKQAAEGATEGACKQPVNSGKRPSTNVDPQMQMQKQTQKQKQKQRQRSARERAGARGQAAEATGEPEAGGATDLSAAWDRFQEIYPPHRLQNVLAVQRAFFDLHRQGLLPEPPDLLAKLEAYAGCSEWQREGGKFVPRAERWLSEGYWKRDPPKNGAGSRLPDGVDAERMERYANRVPDQVITDEDWELTQ